MTCATWKRCALVLSLLVGLSGCAGVYRVDNQVESFARWSEAATPSGDAKISASPVPAPPQQYRFERLPSQDSGPGARPQTELEQLAQSALAPLGWALADAPASAPWTVQVQAESTRLPRAPWEDPWDSWGGGWSGRVFIGSAGSGAGVMWSPWIMRSEFPYHLRQVSLLIRESATGRVVYETRAAHDGRWNSTLALWRAMLEAALKDFPHPPTGVRQVNLDVPR